MNSDKNPCCGKQSRLLMWSSIGIFLFFFVFFTRIHPIVVFDTDDWAYIYHARKAVPVPGIWNPARVLPEILMPLSAFISVNVFMPFTDDYIISLTIGFALIVSAFVTLYFGAFLVLIRRRFMLSDFQSICILLLFVLFHFLVCRADNSGNDYMFCTTDATCYFYYIIPALLNCTLVMWIWGKDITLDFFTPEKVPEKAVFVLAVYLAVFSNLYQSIIIAVFCGVKIIDSFFKKELFGGGFLGFIKANSVRIIIVFMWFVSALLEFTGGRSNNLHRNSPGFGAEIKETINLSVSGISKYNSFFLLLLVLFGFFFVLFFIINRKHPKDEFKICMRYIPESFLCLVFIYIFLLLVCAKSGPDRISHCDVLFGALFFVFIIMLSVVTFFIRQYKLSGIVLPFLITVILFETFTQGRTFRESNQWDIDGKTCMAVSQDVVRQIVEADKAGQSEIELELLSGKTETDFPHSVKFAWVIPDALYRHGIISRDIEVIPVQSDSYNTSFGIEPNIGK